MAADTPSANGTSRSTLVTLTRRRAILVLAAAAGMPVVASLRRWTFSAGAASSETELARGLLYREGQVHVWQGTALGADAEIRLAHSDPAEARRIIAACLAEVERLERIFSLSREDSEISRLNREKALVSPSEDMRRLFATSIFFSEQSGGAFDVTVQPLWELYADHFTRNPADEAGPDPAAITAARARIGYRRIRLTPGSIMLEPGTEVTLNGIAQGYITDRVADIMRAMGIANILLDLGEARALGTRPDGLAWQIGLRDPDSPQRITRTLALSNQAVATSGGYNTRFDALGRFHHLFDPASGMSAHRYLAVSVIASRAVVADALSTAIYVMPFEAASDLVKRDTNIKAIITLPDRRMITLAAAMAQARWDRT